MHWLYELSYYQFGLIGRQFTVVALFIVCYFAGEQIIVFLQ